MCLLTLLCRGIVIKAISQHHARLAAAFYGGKVFRGLPRPGPAWTVLLARSRSVYCAFFFLPPAGDVIGEDRERLATLTLPSAVAQADPVISLPPCRTSSVARASHSSSNRFDTGKESSLRTYAALLQALGQARHETAARAQPAARGSLMSTSSSTMRIAVSRVFRVRKLPVDFCANNA
jgi:hypothetical protein